MFEMMNLLSAHLVGIFREFRKTVRRGGSKTGSGLSPKVFGGFLQIRERFPLDKIIPYREKIKKSRIINRIRKKCRPSALLNRQPTTIGPGTSANFLGYR